jgi:hypothetical protein
VRNQGNDEEHDEQEEQNFGHAGGQERDPRESEYRRQNGDEQEHQSPIQHFLSPLAPERAAAIIGRCEKWCKRMTTDEVLLIHRYAHPLQALSQEENTAILPASDLSGALAAPEIAA